MAWLLAAIILALLVIGFTRRTLWVLALLVALVFASVGVYLAWDRSQQRQREALDAALVMTVAHDGCAPDLPLHVTLHNTSDREMQAVTFDLAGLREGHSIPLYRTRGYVADKILPPGGAWDECFPLPEPVRGTDTRALDTTPPATLRWEVSAIRGRFGP